MPKRMAFGIERKRAAKLVASLGLGIGAARASGECKKFVPMKLADEGREFTSALAHRFSHFRCVTLFGSAPCKLEWAWATVTMADDTILPNGGYVKAKMALVGGRSWEAGFKFVAMPSRSSWVEFEIETTEGSGLGDGGLDALWHRWWHGESERDVPMDRFTDKV
uniref:DUF1579 domain-containing protein n=1 Tax=Panagrellus redivivus TaxID=6233 RepID=A0A7E4UY38_PANRE